MPGSRVRTTSHAPECVRPGCPRNVVGQDAEGGPALKLEFRQFEASSTRKHPGMRSTSSEAALTAHGRQALRHRDEGIEQAVVRSEEASP